ncbi:MAG: PIN domain-containing protein [Verrucomicrobiota bacterium]
MKFLLDVNVIVAALLPAHAERARFVGWAGRFRPADFANCALTELGFIRVAMVAYGYSITDARAMLRQLRRDGVGYLGNLPRPAEVIPSWVAGHRQTTAAYLCAVAAAHGLRLATFDTSIKDRAVELIA